MTAAVSLRNVYLNWAKNFGCTVSTLFVPGISIVPHAGLGDWEGAFFLRHRTSCVISVPASRVLSARALAAGRASGEAFEPAFVRALFPAGITGVIGPAWLGYADEMDFRPVAHVEARLLNENDRAALEALLAVCEPLARQHSGIQPDRPPVFGRFVGGDLVAAGTLEDTRDGIESVGIITHPDRRGQGHATDVVSAMTQYALDRGSIVQYRTLLSNAPSMAVARKLGFHGHAETLAVRLA